MTTTSMQTDVSEEAIESDAGEHRILLVEDDPVTANVMKRLLQTVGVAVDCVVTVKEGLAALSSLPTVIVLDLLLPDGCGVEILEAVRAAHLRSKVAVVSGSSDPDTFVRMRAARPDAVFGKPLDFEDFVQWLCEAFPEAPNRGLAA